ncbi:HLA class II histocompatibility antigen, DR alpha chain-like [Apteryx mantelli]|uniref:HLA class II histocompatibility antigen, DR alpha chain-like n=1 Tax=Apteryx mantelli TaxID=2696672 RepID=A0ABM4FXS9_9AVES
MDQPGASHPQPSAPQHNSTLPGPPLPGPLAPPRRGILGPQGLGEVWGKQQARGGGGWREQDHTFRKFSYLPFIPTWGDSYDCRMEHWGLPKALLKHWEPQVPLPMSESTETLVCTLGLAVGIVGIIVGTILIIKAMKMNSAPSSRGPL